MIKVLGPVNSEAYLRGELTFAKALLNRMPARRRRIFILVVVYDLSYLETAQKVGASLEAVRRELLKAFETCAAFTARENKRSRK